jgi:hypothetical protein
MAMKIHRGNFITTQRHNPDDLDLKLLIYIIYYTTDSTLWMADRSGALPLPTRDDGKTQTHLFLEWDSNPRSQYSTVLG